MIKRSSLLSWIDAGKPTEYIIAAILLIASFCILVTIVFISPGSAGMGGDNTLHYQISHFSWQHPELFLHHWGKPLYTLLSSPWAQFGLFGARLFNILSGLAAAWLAYLTLSRLGFRNAYLVIVFIVFAPIYFITQIATLTEILFSLLLMLVVYLYFSDRILLSAIVLSFLPLARSEGIIFLPIFALAYLFRRQWWAIPLLTTGFLTYSIAGLKYYHDFLWLIHQNPYPIGESSYGSGPLLHFISNTKYTIGLPIAFLMIIGSIVLFWRLQKTSGKERLKTLNIIWIILIPFVVFFAFHSLLWWKGIGGSLGLTRVIVSVVPLCGMVAFIGIDAISNWIGTNRKIKIIILLSVVFIVTAYNFRINHVPFSLDPVEKVIVDASDWIGKENKTHRIVNYYEPQIIFNLGLDPWDTTACRSMYMDGYLNTDAFAEGSLIVWDSHFGPNDCHVPLDTILSKHNLKLLKVFRPEKPVKVMGGYDFEVYVFRKLSATAPEADNYALFQKLKQYNTEEFNIIPILNFGFEPDNNGAYSRKVTTEVAHTGKHSCKIDETITYGPGTSILLSSVNKTSTYPLRIQASAYVLLKEKPQACQMALVISVENKNKTYLYQAVDLAANVEGGTWTNLSTSLTMDTCKSSTDNIKVYLWHRGKENVFLDDFSADIVIRKN